MSLLIKIGIPCVLGASGIGVVTSNAFIKTKQWVKLKKSDENGWKEKLDKLKAKLKDSTKKVGLAEKIGGTNQSHLALGSGETDFSNREQAKTALQTWCDKDLATEKDLVNKLCKKEEDRGWLFG